MREKYLIKKIYLAVLFITFAFSNLVYSDLEITAQVVGKNIVNALEINRDGIKIEVSLEGGDFKDELTEEQKQEVVKNLEIDLDDGHIFDGERGNLDRLESIKDARGEYLISVGTDESGKNIDSIDRFLSYKDGIRDEISKNGNIYINDKKNLIIECNSRYFRDFKNNIIYTQGGVPLAWGDIPIYVKIPKEIIKEEVGDLYTSNFYAIIEMKASLDLLEYNDEKARDEKDENRTHIVDNITEEDIRKGGKLLKVTINSRNGPTKWTIERKRDPQFIRNMFRTDRDYGKSEDDINWTMIENKLGANLEYGDDSLSNWNGYWISKIEDNRQETSLEDLKEMYYIVEFPVVENFDIDEDMNVYISLLSGMIGGSGRSGKQGTPYWGQDGRLSFTILSGNDSDKVEAKKDNIGNNKGFDAGSGENFGNETGEHSGSDNDYMEEKKITKQDIKEIEIDSDSDEDKKENKDKKELEKEKDKSQGSSGESDIEGEVPSSVYEVSNDILEETTIKEASNYYLYVLFIVFIIGIGATYRYYKFSRFIR